MTETKTFKTDREALQYALDEIANLHKHVVELQGRLVGGAYAFNSLVLALENEGLIDHSKVAAYVAAGADAYATVAERQPDQDATSAFKREKTVAEMKSLVGIITADDGPAFEVIDGGKSPNS